MPKQENIKPAAFKAVSEKGNAVIAVLVVLVIVAVGALAYMSGQLNIGKPGASETAATTAAAQTAPASGQAEQQQQAQAPEVPPLEIRQGNPVVAKVAGDEIKRLDVLNFIQSLPPNARQLPPAQLFPVATQQVINARLIQEKAKKANLDNDKLVKEQLAAAKEQIVRTVFVQKEVEKAITEDRLKAAYEQYKAAFPEIEEAKARHILVKEESEAKDIIKKLKDGGDFAALAKESSIDATKDNGGQLSYFSEKEVVPEFAKAAFSQKVGEVSSKPVKSEFGYHIIEVQDKRQRPPATFEVAKPFLAGQLQNVVLNEIMQKWRDEAKVEIFDINGDAIEPAAGEEAAAQ